MGIKESKMISTAGEESNERQGLETKELYFTQKDHWHFRLCKEEHQATFTKSNEKESEVFKSQMTALNHREKQWGMEEQNRPHKARVRVEGKEKSSSISILLVLGQVNELLGNMSVQLKNKHTSLSSGKIYPGITPQKVPYVKHF